MENIPNNKKDVAIGRLKAYRDKVKREKENEKRREKRREINEREKVSRAAEMPTHSKEAEIGQLDDVIARVERDSKIIDKVYTVDDIIEENKSRINKLRLVGIDQKSGEGVPGHSVRVFIPDYFISEQFLTPEVANNRLYSDVVRLGSIVNYVRDFNSSRGLSAEKGINSEMVAQQLLMRRLERDPAFAFAVCFYIQDKASGKTIPYILNYPQILLLEKLESMRTGGIPIRLILLKARQWGGSTLVQLYMAWIQLFLKIGWNSVIIAQTKDTARRIKGMYSRTLANFKHTQLIYKVPKIKFSPKENSASDSTITNENGGKVIRDNVVTIASFENFEATRGANFAMAHYSEVAYWVNTPGKTAEALITNIAGGMLMAPLTLEVLESTANGMSGYFYDEYQIAKNPEIKSARQSMFIPFYYILNDTKPFASEAEARNFVEELLKNKDSDTETSTTESGSYLFSLWKKGASLESINWYIEKRASFHDHASMASEAPSDDVECFKHSGHTIFDQYLVDKYCKAYAQEPAFKGDIMQLEGHMPKLTAHDDKGLLYIWQYADCTPTEDRYLVVVDVGGRSTKADFSVITVVDRWPLRFGGKIEVVARWRGHIRYDFLALKAVMIARMYCNALLVFESNTFDKKKAESTEFVEYGDHTRGILSTIEETYDNLYMRVSTSAEDIRQGRFKKVGFQTNVKTKQDMVDHFIVSFEDDARFLERDVRAYQEMAIYEQREDGTYGNIVGRDNHDDILMTDMIADLVSESMPVPSVRQEMASESWNLGTINESSL